MEFEFYVAPEELRKIPLETDVHLCGRPTYYRYVFSVEKETQAKLYITALGVYEVFLDGKKIGDYFLSPGWTDFSKRLYYDEFDITISKGKHCLTAIVADGWYAGNVASVGPCHYDKIVALGLQMHMDDGAVITVNDNWRVSYGGYIYADIIHGEYFDESKEPDGWMNADFDDSLWEPAVYVWSYVLGARIEPRQHPPIRHIRTLQSIGETRDSHGNYIYDMGQNASGVVRVKFSAKKNDKLQLRFGEMLDGTELYTANLRTARQTDTFVAGSDGEKEYMPRFTFHGFRYIESSLPLTSVETIVLSSDCKQIGFIETSSKLVNKIYSNQLWGQISNFLDVPTDCPQRNERMGWTGDAQIFARTGMYNLNSREFYKKYMRDVQDAIFADGTVPNVVPRVYVSRGKFITGNAAAAWGDALFIIPYHLWKMYGDTEALENCYNDMKRYFAFLAARAENYIQPDKGYGDWLNVDSITPKNITGTAYFAFDAQLMAEIAEKLGKDEDVKYYAEMYELIKQAFISRFIDKDGKIEGDTQCDYVLALRFGLYEDKEKTAAHLVRTIKERNNHLSTGFVGTSYLLPVLSENGYDELAYTLLLNETYPSWGYCIKMGATTMWERWNSYNEVDGFGDVGMNSFNHYSFGAVAEWMYEYMAGIKALEEGYKRFKIEPHMDKRVPRVKMSYASVSGEITVEYDADAGKCCVTVPAGTQAEVVLPGKECILKAGIHNIEFDAI